MSSNSPCSFLVAQFWILRRKVSHHSHKKQTGLETWTGLAFLHIYVENQAILEPSPLYRASKYKQTKEHGKRTVTEPPHFTFSIDLWFF